MHWLDPTLDPPPAPTPRRYATPKPRRRPSARASKHAAKAASASPRGEGRSTRPLEASPPPPPSLPIPEGGGGTKAVTAHLPEGLARIVIARSDRTGVSRSKILCRLAVLGLAALATEAP